MKILFFSFSQTYEKNRKENEKNVQEEEFSPTLFSPLFLFIKMNKNKQIIK